MPGAQVQRDDEYLSVQIPVPNPQKVTYISAIKGRFLLSICTHLTISLDVLFNPWLVLSLENGEN